MTKNQLGIKLEVNIRNKSLLNRRRAAEKSTCSQDWLAILTEDVSDAVREAVAGNPNCPVKLLRRLAYDKERSVRRSVEQNSNCPVELRTKIELEEKEVERRIATAKNPSTSRTTLSALVNDKEYWVRLAVAENPNCPAETLIMMSESEGSDQDHILRAIVRNPNCPGLIFEKHVTSKMPFVRRYIAKNPSCPEPMLVKLAMSKDIDVCSAVVANPACTLDILKKLAKHKDPAVRRNVAKNLNCPTDVLGRLAVDLDGTVRRTVVENVNCPESFLQVLSKDKDREVRRTVASVSSCPIYILQKLAKDRTVTVREAVAENLNTPIEILDRLASDSNIYVRYAVACNANCADEMWDRALKYEAEPILQDNSEPKEIDQMRKLVSEIRMCCPKVFDHNNIEFLEENLSEGAWSWRPLLKTMVPERINRCGDVLNGPIYTCEGYEWPIHDELPMVPFIQLDLRHCSRVSGVDLGTGLLQVWFGVDLNMGEDAFIRVVPENEVSRKKLLPIPIFDVERLEYSTPAYLQWANPDSRILATQIVGYDRRRYSLPDIYVNTAEAGIDQDTWRISGLTKRKKLEISKECLDFVDQFINLRRYALKHWSPATHLMGTFDFIQYSFAEMKYDGETPLFCIDGEDCYNFGDGNGQLTFSRDNEGNVSFKLCWSCM